MSLKSRNTTLKSRKPEQLIRSNTMNRASITVLGWITVLSAASLASGLNIQSGKPARLRNPGPDVMSDIISANGQIPKRLPMTKLLYSHGDYSYSDDDQRKNEHRSAVTGLRTRMSSWWSNAFPVSQADEDDPQAAVDGYLEFLDRRYHRLHDDGQSTASPAKPFSAWDWLMDKDGTNDASMSPENHEDALYVLGVAELASEQLLQKHMKSPAPEQVIDTKATTIPHSKTNGLFGSTSSKPSTSVLQRLKQQRRALIAYQEKQIKRAALVSVKAAAMAPLGIVKTAEAVWRYGGGKKTFALTLGLLTGCFLLIRPAMAALVGVVVE